MSKGTPRGISASEEETDPLPSSQHALPLQAQRSHVADTSEDEAEAAWNVQLTPPVPPRPLSVVPGTSSPPPGPQGKRGRGSRAHNDTLLEERVLAAVERQSTPTPVPSENDFFFKCLIPAPERLSHHKQQEIKFEFYRRVYEAGLEVEAAP